MTARTRQEARILIADDEAQIRTILAVILREEGFAVQTAQDGPEAIALAGTFLPQILIVDLQMPRMDGVETFVEMRRRFPQIVGIILTAHGTIESAVSAIRQGVYDYIQKPFDNEQILAVVRRACEVVRLTEEVGRLRLQLGQRYCGLHSIVGESAAMVRLRQEIRQMARTDAAVLIEGESGTGKELAARAIHSESDRTSFPFVIVDCAAIPAGLIESEFFGHERGAFTDALEQRSGKFEEAHTGTIFLDEIGELPLGAQTKLLRVLQEKEFTRIGSPSTLRVDVRVVAATNKNLEEEVGKGTFREDLYYRLNVLKLQIPPLRDHKADIPAYVEHFLTKHRETFRKSLRGISDPALAILTSREWKGNIRELENVLQRAMLNAVAGGRIETEDLRFLEGDAAAGRTSSPPYDPASGLESYIAALTGEAERRCILDALRETGWNRTEAAMRLKISRKTLFNKMQQHRLGDE